MLTTIKKKLIEKMKISILASNHFKTALCLIGSSLIISVNFFFFLIFTSPENNYRKKSKLAFTTIFFSSWEHVNGGRELCRTGMRAAILLVRNKN